jgi:hypothetical protein
VIGVYHYEKQLPREHLLCEVRMFQFWVAQQLDDWPESSQRETRWFDVPETVSLVDEGGLAESFAGLLRLSDGKDWLAKVLSALRSCCHRGGSYSIGGPYPGCPMAAPFRAGVSDADRKFRRSRPAQMPAWR